MKIKQSGRQRVPAASRPHDHRSKKLTLPSGTTGFVDDTGKWVCTGSQMGRRDILPSEQKEPYRLRLTRLPFIDGCYDWCGAYWGFPANIWCAWSGGSALTEFKDSPAPKPNELEVCVFVRANGRDAAKKLISQKLLNAKFYR